MCENYCFFWVLFTDAEKINDQIPHNLHSVFHSALHNSKYSYSSRTTVPFVTAHLEIFHCTHHPVIPKSDLYFTFCSTLNALSKKTSK